MKVEYRQRFLKDLKKLRKQPVYKQLYDLTFEVLPNAKSLQDVSNVKAIAGASNRYRIRLGDYRIGIVASEEGLELLRVLHRKEFYRYFP